MKTTFFVEFPEDCINLTTRGNLLLKTFTSKDRKSGECLAQYLGTRGYAVSLAMSSFDSSSIEAVRLLNTFKVPVTAWIVLPWSQGYWSNTGSIAQTLNRTEKVLEWFRINNLKLYRIGFDNELPVQLVKSVTGLNFISWYRELKAHMARTEPSTAFIKFVEDIQQNYEVEFYNFPKGLSFFGGGLASPGVSVEMLYSSLFPSMPGWLRFKFLSLLKNPVSIPALGIITGIEKRTPGVMLTKKQPRHLTVHELAQDLRLASNIDQVYIFGLNSFGTVLKTEHALALSGL